MYSAEQTNFLEALQAKIQAFFRDCHPPGHGFDHALRVTAWVKQIAAKESARDPWLCEVAALVHDIGRVPEYRDKRTERHHELSYGLLRQWFIEDELFNFLTISQKKELLYAVRYHWNDEANEYDTAWMLRDADKLDCFGDIGLARSHEYCEATNTNLLQSLRWYAHMVENFRTATARKIFVDGNLYEPIRAYERRELQAAIQPINL